MMLNLQNWIAVCRKATGQSRSASAGITHVTEYNSTGSDIRLQAVMNAAVDGIITITDRGIIESTNPAAEQLFGYSAAEMAGRNVSMLMPSPFREEHDGYLSEYVRTGERRIIGIGREVKARRKDGSLIPLYLSVSEVNFDGRRIYTGFLHDLRGLKQAEERATELGQILEGALNEIYVVDAETLSFLFVNRGALENTGYTAEEVSRLTPVAIQQDFQEDQFRRMTAPLIGQDQTVVQYETNHKRSDGTKYNALVRLQAAEWNERPALVAVVQDVSELRTAQQRLLQSERLAAIGQMVTGLAHESRNALQRARACIDLLTLDLDGQDEQLALTDKISRALSDLQRNYEEVQNYAAPIVLERRHVDLNSLWEKIWSDLAAVRGDRDFKLVIQSGYVPPRLSLDEHRMGQLSRNIMENSLAACQDPGVIEVSYAPAELLDRPGVRISFTDNGPGFTVESAEQVFQPFYTTKQKGTGLGMAIASRIVEAHGGVIARGKPERGAEIIIELPVE